MDSISDNVFQKLKEKKSNGPAVSWKPSGCSHAFNLKNTFIAQSSSVEKTRWTLRARKHGDIGDF